MAASDCESVLIDGGVASEFTLEAARVRHGDIEGRLIEQHLADSARVGVVHGVLAMLQLPYRRPADAFEDVQGFESGDHDGP